MYLVAVSASNLSVSDISAAITAIGGIVIGLLAARRGKKADKISADSNLLSGYGQIVKDLQAEIERIRSQYTDDIKAWSEERATLIKQLAIAQDHVPNSKPTRRRKVVPKTIEEDEVEDADS